MATYSADYQIYLFECDWYSEWDDKDHHDQGLLMAPSYGEAIQAITDRLPYAENIFITAYDDRQFVFMNQTLFKKMLDPKDEYGLNYPEEPVQPEMTQTVTYEFVDGVAPESVNDNEIPVSAEEDNCWLERYSHHNPEDTYREDFGGEV